MFELIINHVVGRIPDWIWPFAAGGGLAAYFVFGIMNHFPQLKWYVLVGRPVSFTVFVLGVFFYGSAGVLTLQQQALQEANQRVELAQQASISANVELQTVMAGQTHLIKGRSYGVRQQIIHDQVVIDRDCNRINDTAWTDYNRAVKNQGEATPR